MAGINRFVEIVRRIVGQPHFAFIVLPDKSLGWVVYREQGRLCHDRRAEFWIAEDDYRARAHFNSELLARSGMIDASENNKARTLSRFDRRLKPIDRVWHRMIARLGNYAVICVSRRCKQGQ